MLTPASTMTARRRRVALGGVLAAALFAGACSGVPPTDSATATGPASATEATTTTASTIAEPSSTAVTVPGISTPTTTPTATSTSTQTSAGQDTETAVVTTSTTPPTTVPATAPTTPPAEGAGLAVTAADRTAAAAIVAGMSTAQKAASVIMVTGAQAIGPHLLAAQPYAGVILFAPGGAVDGTASGTPAQVAAVTAALVQDAATSGVTVSPLIATDQEYGLVQRLKNGFTSFPSAAQLGSIGGAEGADFARQVAQAAAQEMRAVGVTVDFAPVFGVLPDDGSASAIGKYGRSYGTDPAAVAEFVAAAVQGYQAGGVVASMKHFPGLARIADDSHVTLPTLGVSCANWNAHEAIPARAGVAAGTLMVMTGHVLMPATGDAKLPASISKTVVTNLLKGPGAADCAGMNFRGVAVTDSMQMEPISGHYSPGKAAVAALAAGEDLLLMPPDPAAAAAGITAAVANGTLPQARLDDAATAVLALRIASARMTAPSLDVVNSAAHRQLAADAFAAAG